jgi:hypothetical protein
MSADDNQESSSNDLVPRPGTGLAETGRRKHPVLARMSRDLLARAEAQGLSTARYRLGKYVFREPDYRQILDWAEALGKAPEWVLEQLEESKLEPGKWEDWEPITFVVEDGAIRSLVWDFDRLPQALNSWTNGLLIKNFGLKGKYPDFEQVLTLSLPYLRNLYCCELGITQLNLSNTPKLTMINCRSNRLASLDLSATPKLTKIDCSDNLLTALSLFNLSNLKELNCTSNQLAEIELFSVPKLTRLACGWNSLTELNISMVPDLIHLWCSANRISELDLSLVPKLTRLWCYHTQIKTLNLFSVPVLSELRCDKSVRIDYAPTNLKIERQ